ncbi:MAG: HEAT repeat domain-containing protein [Bdellovibrionales bacterium]
MIHFLLWLTLTRPGFSAPLVNWETELTKPMETRIKTFRANTREGAKFLRSVAFDSKKSLNLRWRAITTMGKWDTDSFAKELEGALQSPEWYLRNAALIAVLNGDREWAIGHSVKSLSDASLMVRTQAVRNLIGLDARETETVIWKQIWDKRNFKGNQSLWIRAHLAEALARFSARGHNRKAFERLILDHDTRIHRWAIMGLEKSTGWKLSDHREPTSVQRRKWLAGLGIDRI